MAIQWTAPLSRSPPLLCFSSLRSSINYSSELRGSNLTNIMCFLRMLCSESEQGGAWCGLKVLLALDTRLSLSSLFSPAVIHWSSFFSFNFLLCIGVLPVNNVIVSSEQQTDSAMHTHVSILLQILSSSVLIPVVMFPHSTTTVAS